MGETRNRKVNYQPSGKPVRLSPKRYDVLDLLQDYRYLPQSYIGELLGYNYSTHLIRGREIHRYDYLREMLRRMRKDGGWLFCPETPLYREATYALTEGGEHALKKAGRYRGIEKTGEPYDDELGVCMIRASFDIGVRKYGLEFISADSILQHPNCPKETRDSDTPFEFPVTFDYTTPKTKKTYTITRNVKHDCNPFGIARATKTGRTSIIIAGIELDLDTEGLHIEAYKKVSVAHHLLGILAASRKGIYRDQLGIPNWFIPFICVGEQRMKAAMRTLDELTDGKGARNIIFQWIPDYTQDGGDFPLAGAGALTQSYHRVGYEPFNFLEELGIEK